MALTIGTFTARTGHLLGGINEANTYSGTTTSTRANTIYGDFASLAAERDVVDGLYTQAVNVRAVLSTFTNYLSGLIQTNLQAMCRDDSARPRFDTIPGWLDKLNRDMVASSDTFTRPGSSATIAIPAIPGTNIGDGYLICSVVEPVDGKDCYYGYAETIRANVTSDSYTGTATAGAESWLLTGETSVSKRDWNWPKGSGFSRSLTTVTPATDAILTDGGFEAWGGSGNNTPTSWSLGTGTVAGTHVLRGSSSPYGGNYYAQFTGDGVVAVSIYQDITTKVKASTNYAFQFWVKVPAATLSTANLRIALVDGSGTVINDNNSIAQSSTLNTGSLNADTTWTRVGVVLRTPRNLPASVRLELRFPAGNLLDNAKSVYVDFLTGVTMTQMYSGGPYISIIGGATAFASQDAFTATIAQSYTGTGADATHSWVRCLDRVFSLADAGIRLTVAAGTIGSATAGTQVDGTTLIV